MSLKNRKFQNAPTLEQTLFSIANCKISSSVRTLYTSAYTEIYSQQRVKLKFGKIYLCIYAVSAMHKKIIPEKPVHSSLWNLTKSNSGKYLYWKIMKPPLWQNIPITLLVWCLRYYSFVVHISHTYMVTMPRNVFKEHLSDDLDLE